MISFISRNTKKIKGTSSNKGHNIKQGIYLSLKLWSVSPDLLSIEQDQSNQGLTHKHSRRTGLVSGSSVLLIRVLRRV